MEAFLEAKQAGKIRYVGFTGHKDPRIHLQMLAVAAERGFHFDAVQMPLNGWTRTSAASRTWRCLPGQPRHRRTRHEELRRQRPAQERGAGRAAGIPHYALNLPTSVVITGIENQRDLDQAFEAVRTFAPMSKDVVVDLLESSRPYALEGRYELFKTSTTFDSTAKNADWLGDEADGVKVLAPVIE